MTVDAPSFSLSSLSFIISAQCTAVVGLQTSATLCVGCECLLGTNAHSRDGSIKTLEDIVDGTFTANFPQLVQYEFSSSRIMPLCLTLALSDVAWRYNVVHQKQDVAMIGQ